MKNKAELRQKRYSKVLSDLTDQLDVFLTELQLAVIFRGRQGYVKNCSFFRKTIVMVAKSDTVKLLVDASRYYSRISYQTPRPHKRRKLRLSTLQLKKLQLRIKDADTKKFNCIFYVSVEVHKDQGGKKILLRISCTKEGTQDERIKIENSPFVL